MPLRVQQFSAPGQMFMEQPPRIPQVVVQPDSLCVCGGWSGGEDFEKVFGLRLLPGAESAGDGDGNWRSSITITCGADDGTKGAFASVNIHV